MDTKTSQPDMVNVLIRDKYNYALLINNIKSGKDRWEFPGGKLGNEKDLEKKAIDEAKEELGIVIGINGIFGDYETQTPEGDFLCRTYKAKIIFCKPRIMEPHKHREFRYFSYDNLLGLKNLGILVPNLVTALPELEKCLL